MLLHFFFLVGQKQDVFLISVDHTIPSKYIFNIIIKPRGIRYIILLPNGYKRINIYIYISIYTVYLFCLYSFHKFITYNCYKVSLKPIK